MPTNIINYTLPTGTREEMRHALISCFLNETAGTGKGNNASRYQYNVEAYNNYGIYLRRPTQLNKGFDFTVNVEGLSFKKKRQYSNPSHQDILTALTYCSNKYSNEYPAVKKAIIDIYHCVNIDLSRINAFFCDYKGKEHPIQVILLAIKWLFMEQDCAYWNYSGRQMLFDEFHENELV